MLENAKEQNFISPEEYALAEADFQKKTAVLQQEIKKKKLPVILLFEGLSASGKGNRIASVIANLDPRFYEVYSIAERDTLEKRMPMLWRYFIKTPAKGQIAIFDRSWYRDLLYTDTGKKLTKKEYKNRLESIRTMERQLSEDGCLILKFFLLISKKEQKNRLRQLEKKKSTRWRVTPEDKKQNEKYKSYLSAADTMLKNSDFPYAPWHIIKSDDGMSANAAVYRIVTEKIEENLNPTRLPSAKVQGAYKHFTLLKPPLLKDVPLDKTMRSDVYQKMLAHYQKKLLKLHNKIYLNKKPVILAFEGWDAAGKGGNIKRVASALDPRGFAVNPIASPTEEELMHHYLWRFWKLLPKDGHIAIFDRTWYGRVLVERIENLCSEEEWKRAYNEINEFEYELHKWGALILKFWLQIDKEEQLRRFQERVNVPSKRWKITDEDWRNREKWPQYEEAVNEMTSRTSTSFAPWHIIQGNNKRYGRIQTLSIITDYLEKHLS